MKLKARVYQIDMNKKNLLIINVPESISEVFTQELRDALCDDLSQWLQSENMPLWVLTIPEGVEIKLEKVNE